jgi:hypothetical protein
MVGWGGLAQDTSRKWSTQVSFQPFASLLDTPKGLRNLARGWRDSESAYPGLLFQFPTLFLAKRGELASISGSLDGMRV